MTRIDQLRKRLPDALRVYVLTDRGLSGQRSDPDVVRDAIEGGATAIQLRWKARSLYDVMDIGREISHLCNDHGVLFFVNDRVDLAMALDADGVHIGEEDLPLDITRDLVGDRMLIGYSPSTLEGAKRAEMLGADYLGIGPVYDTATKSDAGNAVGVQRIRDVAELVQIPIVGIGGIGIGRAAPVIESGASGVSVISAVVAQEDIISSARDLRREVDEAMKRE